MIWLRNIENNHFLSFYSHPRFPPFLLYVRWKSGVTFVRRCYRDVKVLKCHNISAIVKLWGFFRRSRPANSAVNDRIWPNFELIRDFIVVLVTSKNEKDPIKTEEARVLTTSYIYFPDAQGQLTPQTVIGFSPISNSYVLL